MIIWTIGAGGLLGRAVVDSSPLVFTGSTLEWGPATADPSAWEADVLRFRDHVGVDAWGIVWAAGAATVSSSADEAATELATLRALLACLRDRLPQGPGAFFLTSSAGGVYAGSSDPPFDERSSPVSLSPYGALKLDQEGAVREALSDRCPVILGRLSNLYGPGQNLEKLQGLISRMAMAAATQEPLNIFVSLDTLRDYIYVDDAATTIVQWLEAAARAQRPGAPVRVIASGDAVTVGQLIRTMRLVTKRRIPIALGSHASASAQVLDLRLTPSALPNPSRSLSTPLPVGAKRVYLDILTRLQQDRLTGSPSR